jgi:hypothetical protein
LGGTNGHNMQVITAYNPCKNRNVNLGTTYQQQQRYFITKKKDLTCPIVLFRNHLIKQIKDWHAAGDRIILFMDHNKHVINGQLGKALADKEGLDLQEAIMQHTGTSPGVTFFQGSRPINGLWISSNLDISKNGQGELSLSTKKGRHTCSTQKRSAGKYDAVASHCTRWRQSGYAKCKCITLSSVTTREKSLTTEI